MPQSACNLWFDKTSKIKAKASKGFTGEACQILNQHLSKLVIVILQNNSQSKHWKPELLDY